jgi:hypothetical protein
LLLLLPSCMFFLLALGALTGALTFFTFFFLLGGEGV